MEQLPLFAEDKLHTFKPLAEGGINSLQFFNDSLLSTTSRYYVDIFSFTLPAGHWYLQILTNGFLRTSHIDPFSFGINYPASQIALSLNKSIPARPARNSTSYREAETCYNFDNMGQSLFSAQMLVTTQAFRDGNYTIAARINESKAPTDTLFINNIAVIANQLVG